MRQSKIPECHPSSQVASSVSLPAPSYTRWLKCYVDGVLFCFSNTGLGWAARRLLSPPCPGAQPSGFSACPQTPISSLPIYDSHLVLEISAGNAHHYLGKSQLSSATFNTRTQFRKRSSSFPYSSPECSRPCLWRLCSKPLPLAGDKSRRRLSQCVNEGVGSSKRGIASIIHCCGHLNMIWEVMKADEGAIRKEY